jgi:D-alanyl-D-alanine dipeptidase
MRYSSPQRLCGILVLFLCLTAGHAALARENAPDVREGFMLVTDAAPDVVLEIRYYSTYNFMGARVDGYLSPVAMLTKEAATALQTASLAALDQGCTLKIFDAYRPQIAVNHFVRWAKDLGDQKTKDIFYPQVDKTKLFDLGYIASKSGHSRGSTVDLTLIDRKSGKELDMGSPFDFFGPISHHGTTMITPEQTANRNILKAIMHKAGFRPLPEEWWHYTLDDEPYRDTYFAFPVKQ